MSGETKWPAGPWRHAHGTIFPEDFSVLPPGMVAIASIKTRPRARSMSLMEIATGDLIAAAPDLYASLAEIVAEWGCPNTPKWHRARAALARARGETP